MKKIKSNVGSITVLALSCALFIIIAVSIFYFVVSNSLEQQRKNIETVQGEYNITNDTMEAEYKSLQ